MRDKTKLDYLQNKLLIIFFCYQYKIKSFLLNTYYNLITFFV